MDSESYEITFGKYKGMTLKEIVENDRKYLVWLYSAGFKEKFLQSISEFVKMS
jgi:uncharacterized protein (DUF3820 family)